MGRPKRANQGGYVYHVLNRANARMPIFEDEGDYGAFEKVLAQAVERTQTRLLAYCVMPNHWHLVVWPREDGEFSRFVGWLTLTHTQRWHAHRHNKGTGHLYQGRFKSFPIQEDDHLYAVARYVERNAVRANLVRRAERWRWGSLYRGRQETPSLFSQIEAFPDQRPVMGKEPARRGSATSRRTSVRRMMVRNERRVRSGARSHVPSARGIGFGMFATMKDVSQTPFC